MLITSEEIAKMKSILNYDCDTGLFTWAKDVSRNVKAGFTAGSLNSSGYLRITVNRKAYYAHRLAWIFTTGEQPKGFIDHIDGCKSNNAFNNLREVTPSENLQNQRKANQDNQSGLLGAHWHIGCNKFHSQIGLNGKYKHLGYFNTAEEAHAAYLYAKRLLHTTCSI